VMMMLALLPTIAAVGFYAWIGHLDALVQANFVSVFHRAPFPAETRWKQIKFVAAKPIGFVIATPCAFVVQWQRRMIGNSADFWLLTGWTVFSLIGFGILGDFYDFYFITALLPISILVAPLITMGRVGFATTCTLLIWPIVLIPHYYFQTTHNDEAIRKITSAVKPYIAHRCLYIYDGPTIIYLLTNACAPTRFIYPDHLNNPTEAPALGVNPVTEEAHLLASRPGAVITADRPLVPRVNPATQRLVRGALARDYVLVARVTANDRVLYAWALKDLHPAPATIHDPRANNPE